MIKHKPFDENQKFNIENSMYKSIMNMNEM